ncbi:MAG: PocR ligand-binding domain-containing protein [Spirochaetes bacterium]|nr:PocR ligand-binding domain-containing protein [Spirochaetota bacterium]
MLRAIIEKKALGEVLTLLSRLFDVRIAFFDPQGRELTAFDVKPMSDYCAARRQDPGFNAQCEACDRLHLERARKSRKSQGYECHAGLREAVIPLVTEDGHYVGAMMMGQVRVHEIAPGGLSAAALAAYRRLPDHGAERFSEMVRLLEHMSVYLIRAEIVRHHGRSWEERLHLHIAEHLEEKITLPVLARLAGRSPSFISRYFADEFGLTPREFIERERMKEAFTLLRAGEKVNAIAARLGYYDEFHFSKAFKKRFGKPPSLYRKLGG